MDYTTKPYAQWLEEVLPQMVELDPVSIGLVMILPDRTTGTVYFNADRNDMEVMRRAIGDDSVMEFISVNADIIARILSGEEDDEDEIEGLTTDTEDY